jgi:hypothetical protein
MCTIDSLLAYALILVVLKDYSTAKSEVLRRYTSHLGRVSLRSAIPRLSYLVIVVREDYSTA